MKVKGCLMIARKNGQARVVYGVRRTWQNQQIIFQWAEWRVRQLWVSQESVLPRVSCCFFYCESIGQDEFFHWRFDVLLSDRGSSCAQASWCKSLCRIFHLSKFSPFIPQIENYSGIKQPLFFTSSWSLNFHHKRVAQVGEKLFYQSQYTL